MTSCFQLPSPAVLQQSHIPSLNGLRGISIIIVILAHTFGDRTPWYTGGFGVSIFFVISGFLITLLLLKEKHVNGYISLRNFYIRRVLRIFPVAWLYLAVLTALNYIFELNITVNSFISAAFCLENTTLLLQHSDYVCHYWSLSVEEQYYLIFPFLLKKGVRFYLLVATAALVAIPLVNYADFNHLVNSIILHHAVEVTRFTTSIVVGSLFAIGYFYNWTPFISSNGFKFILSILLFAAATVLNQNILIRSTTFGQLISNFCIGALIILNVQPATNPVYMLLNSRWLTFMGVLSYSIYIWQQIFIFAIPWKNSFPGANSPIFNWPLLMVVSYCSYYFYERKFLKLKEHFKTIPTT